MKTFKTLLFTVLAVIFLQNVNSQFLKTYNLTSTSGSTECGRSIEMSVSNTFTVSGYSNSSPNAGGYDWMFQKFNFTGTVMGNMLLGFPLADSCFSHTKLGGITANNVRAGFYTTTWKAYTREIASWSMIDENTLAHINSKMVIDSFKSAYRSVVKGHLGTNYVLAGNSEANTSNGGMRKKILAGLYDASGNKIWLNRYSTSNFRNEAAFSICYQPFDSSYAVTGVTVDSTAFGNIKRVFVLKLDLNGVPVWYKIYTPQTTGYSHTKSESRRIIPMTDGSFVITGWTEEPVSQTNMNVWIFRVSSNGGAVWSNTYGAANVTEQSFAIERNGNGTELVLTGFTTRYGNEDLLNMKIDGTGSLLWTRSTVNALGSDRGYDVKFPKKMMHSTAFYWFTGQFHKTPLTGLNSYLMKTSLNGHIVSYAGCTDSLTLPKTSTILRIDTASVSVHALNDLTISPVKTAKKVKADTVCYVPAPPEPFEVDNIETSNPNKFALEQNYPNPFNPSTSINFSVAADGNVNIKVYDVTGKQVSEIVNEFKTSGSYSAVFNASSLPSGVYFYTLKTEGFEQTKKMLLVK